MCLMTGSRPVSIESIRLEDPKMDLDNETMTIQKGPRGLENRDCNNRNDNCDYKDWKKSQGFINRLQEVEE